MISPEYTTKDANGHIVSFYPQNVYRCTDCGKEIMDLQGTERISAYSLHVFYDGKCVVCDYDKSSCLHENKLLLGEERKILEYTSNGESGHTVKYVLQSVYSCPDCMETIIVDDPEAEEKEYTEAHYFYEGQCIRCQYESSCAHENKTLLSEDRDIRKYITTNDGNHKVYFYPKKNYCCLDCGEVIVETEEEMAEAVEAHSFSNGICVCGCLNKCTHENKILDSENRCYNIYTYKNESTHTVSYHPQNVYRCPDCGEYISDPPSAEEKAATENHVFVNGTCVLCGHGNTCKHSTNVYKENIHSNPTFSKGDATGHEVSYYLQTIYYCLDCGEQWTDAPSKDKTVEKETHVFADGVCLQCGYKNLCEHEKKQVAEAQFNPTYEKKDGTCHTVTYYPQDQYYCPDCGDHWAGEPKSETVEKAEAHVFTDGVCVLCGEKNTCPHDESIITQGDRLYPIIYRDINSDGHTAVFVPITQKICKTCNELIESVRGEAPISVKEAHQYDKGVCLLCGYKKPASTPAPVATESAPAAAVPVAPVYVAVSKNMEVHGFTVAEEPELVDVALSSSEDLMGDIGVKELKIKDLDKILIYSELRDIEKLDLDEQLMVLLSVLGYEDLVRDTLEEREISLSAEAEELLESIVSRIGEMSSRQQETFKKQVKEYFGISLGLENNEPSGTLRLSLEIQDSEGKRIERFSFTEEDEAWVLKKIEIAK